MSFIDRLKEKIKSSPKRVVLPEGEDIRTLKAAETLIKDGLAKEVYILGDKDTIYKLAKDEGIDLSRAFLINPITSPWIEDFSNELYELRKHKGLTREEAYKEMKENVLDFGAMMLRKGFVDACIAGAVNTTANVIRSAIHVVGVNPRYSLVSSFFIMETTNKNIGYNGVLFYADSAVVIDPDPEQLADIAINTGESFKKLTGEEPIIAMLSFSTKGSAKHPKVDKVVKALEIAKSKAPELLIDGELQVDAAIIPEVGKRKAPNSKVAGKANIFIFPDLDAGNIAYKITERIGGATATGPIVQGLNKPMCDLSRGASFEDIVNTVVVAQLLTENTEDKGGN